MGKLLDFLKTSNRYKHLIGGCLIGLGADNCYCAAYVGLGVASPLWSTKIRHGAVLGTGQTGYARSQVSASGSELEY
jgi:hypothetical protein